MKKKKSPEKQLINLTCPTMSDFRWYNDMFFTKVYTRTNCNVDFWKERFITLLPKHFAEKFKKTARKKI